MSNTLRAAASLILLLACASAPAQDGGELPESAQPDRAHPDPAQRDPAQRDPATTDPAAPYTRSDLLYSGMASIPWHGAYSPDGALVAVVEGHPTHFVEVIDAKTNARRARHVVETQPASHRPVFTRDSARLLLIEDEALVERARTSGWKPTRRIPLGFRPRIHARPRPLVLSPDGGEVAFVDDGRAYVVDLRKAQEENANERVRLLEVADAAAVYYLGGELAVSRWGDGVAETVRPPRGPQRQGATHPFAILAASADGAVLLVARKARDERAAPLHLVAGLRGGDLAAVPVPGADLLAAEFSPDGAHLVTIERRRIGIVRNARTGAVLQRITEYEEDRFIGVAFSPDGRTLVTAGRREGDLQRSVLRWRRD